MGRTKIKPADIIYPQILTKDIPSVAPLTYGLALWLNSAEEEVSNQIVGLAAALICMLQKYDLNHIDVLSAAENLIFSDTNNNMQPVFKQIMEVFKNKEEI